MYKLRRTEGLLPQSFHHRVSEGLSKKTIKSLRKLKSGQGVPEIAGKRKKLPGIFDPGSKDFPTYTPSLGTMPGPGSFGPVSVGGIIRHS